MKHLWVALIAIGCSKTADKPATTGSATEAKPAPPSAPPAAKAVVKDEGIKQLLAKGTTCKLQQGSLPLDCPEYKQVGEYAFQKQGSTDVAETCATFLADPDVSKRLLAAECLYKLNASGKEGVLGYALDAIESEKDDVVRERLCWGVMGAEAVTAKLEDRTLAVVQKLAADPKSATGAGWLFHALFPQYLMSKGPAAPAKAQAYALEVLKQDGTPVQRAALDSVSMIDDKAAVCAALDANLRPDAKNWAGSAEAVAAMKDACVANLAKTIDFLLAQLKAGDDQLAILKRFDYVFDLDAPTRAKIAKTIRTARPKATEWKRKSFDETATAFEKPAVKRK
jgi:hypothetical protein